jgi:tetratricopeptide (TPR) repeat protein
MRTQKFHSPFLLLVTFFILSSCRDSVRHATPVEKKAETLIGKIADTTLSDLSRDSISRQAYTVALQSGNRGLIWRAFSNRYRLLKAQDSVTAARFLNRYYLNAVQKADTLNKANAYHNKAQVFYHAGISDSAFYYFGRSREQYQWLADSLQQAEKLYYMADILWKYNDYVGMESATTEAVQLLDKKVKTATDSSYIVSAFNHYGLAYTGLLDYESALDAYKKASLYEKTASNQLIIENNKAWVHMEAGEFDKAVRILKPVVENPELDRYNMARAWDNYGYSLYKTGANQAGEWLQKAFDLRMDIHDTYGLIPSYGHLAELYSASDRPRSVSLLKDGYRLATRQGSPDDRLYILRLLHDYTTGAESQRYSDIMISLQDSTRMVQQRAKNQFAKMRYDASLEKERALALQAQKVADDLTIARHKVARLWWLGAVVVIVLSAGGVLIYHRNRARYMRLRSVYETETRISGRLHDEFANDTYQLMIFAETGDLGSAENKEVLLDGLDKLYTGIRNVSRENAGIETGEGFTEDFKQMMAGYGDQHCRVLSKGFDDIDWNALNKQVKITIYRVVLELLVNMRKHSKCSVALLQFSQQGKRASIEYSDDGIGQTSDGILKKNGLRNVENRIDAIKGTVTFEFPDKGFRVNISFPI